MDAFKALDPANRSKSGEEPTAKKDLGMIFEGQQVHDALRNYRLQKKIQYVSSQLENIIKREKIAAKPDTTAGGAANG